MTMTTRCKRDKRSEMQKESDLIFCAKSGRTGRIQRGIRMLHVQRFHDVVLKLGDEGLTNRMEVRN